MLPATAIWSKPLIHTALSLARTFFIAVHMLEPMKVVTNIDAQIFGFVDMLQYGTTQPVELMEWGRGSYR